MQSSSFLPPEKPEAIYLQNVSPQKNLLKPRCKFFCGIALGQGLKFQLRNCPDEDMYNDEFVARVNFPHFEHGVS